MKNWFKEVNLLKEIKELAQIIIFALVIVIPFRFFIAEPFLVEGASMEPNFHTGDYLIVTKISKIERGDILVLIPPGEKENGLLALIPFLDTRKKYIKRIVALPNEEIQMRDGKVFIKKPGSDSFVELEEPYIESINFRSYRTEKLESNEYFVLGDNRPNSKDSEEFGPIREENIVGEPVFRLLPINQIGLFPASYNPEKISN